MSVKGRSFAGGFAIAKQVDIDTPNGTPDQWIPVTSEGIKKARPRIPRAGVFSSPETQCHQAGLETNNGPFALEADAIALGYLLQYVLGPVTSSVAVAGTILAAPVATPGVGGAIADGDYSYAVANVFARTSDSKVHVAAPSAASTPETLSGGGNGDISIAWTNATPPTGYTLTGAAIYRKLDAGSMLFLAYQAGSGTSYADLGAVAIGTAIPAAQAYVHTTVPPVSIASLDLPAFTAIRQLDLTSAVQVAGCKVGKMDLSVAEDGNSAVQFTFDVMGRQSTKISNLSPAFTPVCSMLSHQSRLSIDGTQATYAKAMALSVNNNLSSVYSMDGVPYPRDHNEGQRQITGTLTLGAENFEQWDRLNDGLEFELLNEIEGTPTTEGANIRIDANTLAKPFPYAAEFHMPKCLYDGEVGGSLSGAELMNESPGFGARFSPADGYSIRSKVTNRTASY